MPRVCTLCRRPDREEVDAALVVPAEPLRLLASRFDTSTATLRRHREHLPRALAVAVEAAAVSRADSLLEKVRGIEADAARLLAKAEKGSDLRCAIAATKTLADLVELLMKVRQAEREVPSGGLQTIADLVRRVGLLPGEGTEGRIERIRRELRELSASERSAVLADLASVPAPVGCN